MNTIRGSVPNTITVSHCEVVITTHMKLTLYVIKTFFINTNSVLHNVAVSCRYTYKTIIAVYLNLIFFWQSSLIIIIRIIDLYCDGGDLKAKSSFLEQGMHSVVKCLVSENNISLACMHMHA